MHRELVEKRRWLGEQRFLHALNYCMLLPGPEAQQLAVYIGWLMHRTIGGIIAGAFFVIPSIFVLLILSYIYAAYGNVPYVAGVLDGFKPVVVAIVIEALVKIAGRALSRRFHYAVAFVSFVAIYFIHVPFPVIVLAAAVIGFAGSKLLPESFSAAKESEKVGSHSEDTDKIPLAIDDHGASPEHTLPDRLRVIKILAVGIVLWLLPYAGLIVWSGWTGFHTQEYRFFSLAALVTFGGAYAVLAYVTQAMTTAPYNWITPTQAVDGLALAETTPGPLIMVLQFIGFMAAWNNPPAGMSPLTSGVIGALVATYTTFLPSFLFIFLGAPYIESLRGNRSLGGILKSVTAAVVGVILNLAAVFVAAVILPDGPGGSLNWFALFLTVAAFVGLYRFKLDVLLVILAAGLIGLLRVLFFSSG